MSIRARKTKKGTSYEVRVYAGVDPATGKERRLSKTVRTLREARRAEAELLKKVTESGHVPPSQQRLEEYLHEWLEKETRPNTKRRTYVRYEQIVRVHVVPTLGDVKLDKLTPRHIAGLMADKRKELAPRTCLHVYRVLHRALEVAVRWGLLSQNPCDGVEPPRVEDTPIQVISTDQLNRLLEEAKKERLYPFYLTAAKTGMRIGELCGLRWQDVDLDRGVIVVAQTLDKPGVKPLFSSPKNRRARQVPLTPDVVRALRDLRGQQAVERTFFGTEYEDYGLVFCQPFGRPLDPHSIARWHWKRLCRAAGLPDNLRFHDLRHTFTSRALQAGANPRAVSEIAGHHDAGFTLRRYAHVGLDDTKEAVLQLEEYLNSHKTASAGHSAGDSPAKVETRA